MKYNAESIRNLYIMNQPHTTVTRALNCQEHKCVHPYGWQTIIDRPNQDFQKKIK